METNYVRIFTQFMQTGLKLKVTHRVNHHLRCYTSQSYNLLFNEYLFYILFNKIIAHL